MDLLTKPKQAVGFVFSGDLTGVNDLRTWIVSTGRTISAFQLTYQADSDKWVADISYNAQTAGISEYGNVRVSEGFLVATEGVFKLDFKASVEELHESYDEVSS